MITFAALKPGNVFGDGLACGGALTVAEIGLDTRSASAHLVGAAAVASWIPEPAIDAHKWQSAVWIVAGSPGMGGAAALSSGAAANRRWVRACVDARRCNLRDAFRSSACGHLC